MGLRIFVNITPDLNSNKGKIGTKQLSRLMYGGGKLGNHMQDPIRLGTAGLIDTTPRLQKRYKVLSTTRLYSVKLNW